MASSMAIRLCRKSVNLRTYRELPRLKQRAFQSHALCSAPLSYYGISVLCTSLPPNPIQPGQQKNMDDEAAAILACSINTKELRIFRRILRRLRSFAKSLWKAWLVSIRSAEVAIRMSPLLILGPAAIALSLTYKGEEQNYNPVSRLSWWYATKQLQLLGPAFVKFAQWIATRRDIFPEDLCEQFSKLHDQGFTHSWYHTHQTLTNAFGPDYEDRGLHIDKNDIIGSGSAAQVYRGTLTSKDSLGNDVHRTVAIKVLHPRFKYMIDSDLNLMESVAHVLHSLPFVETIQWLNLPRAAQNFGSILRRQADLCIEGDNLTQFRFNFYGDQNVEKEVSYSAISFPCPVQEWTHQDVLVQELVENAKPIADFLSDNTEEGTAIRKELAGLLFRAFLKMVFLDNFVHCDLHPGNVLVQTTLVPRSQSFTSFWTEAEEKKLPDDVKRTIVFLDAGITTSLKKDDQRNLKDLFRAVILNDGDQAGRLMVQRARFERCSEIEGGVDSFARGVQDIVAEFHDRRKQGLTLGAVRIGYLLSRVLDLCRQYGVEVDPAMASIVLSTLILEGLGRSLHDELNLMDLAVPYVLGRGKI